MCISSLWSQERSVLKVPVIGTVSNFSTRFQYRLDGEVLWFTLYFVSQTDKEGNPYLRITICPESEMSSCQARLFFTELRSDINVQWGLLLPALDESSECHKEMDDIIINFTPTRGLNFMRYQISEKKSQKVFWTIQRIFFELHET